VFRNNKKCQKNTHLIFTLSQFGKKGSSNLLFYERESPFERRVLHYFIHNDPNLSGHRAISHDILHNGITTAVLEGVQTPQCE
jgi:hypothetical protein